MSENNSGGTKQPGPANQILASAFYELFSVEPNPLKDQSYFDRLVADFETSLDVAEELKRFHAWTLDRQNGAANAPRTKFRDWLSRSMSYRCESNS